MLEGNLLRRLAPTNAAVQAIVTGGYAWAVTIAPAAWSRGAPALAKVLAVITVVVLGSFLAEARFGEWARRLGLWAFVVGAAAVWCAAPGALGSLRIDAVRGVAGMTGWGLFSLAVAAPARGSAAAAARPGRPLPPRQLRAPGDAMFLGVGVIGAAALQVVGWRVASPERALLVRLVAVAAGIALVTTATDVALLRHKRRAPTRAPRDRSRAMLALVALALLFLVGLISAVRAC